MNALLVSYLPAQYHHAAWWHCITETDTGKIEIYILVSVPLDKPGSAMWRLGQYAQFVWQYTIYKCMSMWNALLYAIVEGDQTQSNVAKPDIDHTTPKY